MDTDSRDVLKTAARIAATEALQTGSIQRAVDASITHPSVANASLSDLLTGGKSILSSTTFWGILISMGLKVAAIAFPGKVDPAIGEPIQQVALLGVSFISDAVAIWGRWKAKEKIR